MRLGPIKITVFFFFLAQISLNSLLPVNLSLSYLLVVGALPVPAMEVKWVVRDAD